MTVSGKEECKIRGFTLNWKNSKLINFEAIRDMICTSRKSVVRIKYVETAENENCTTNVKIKNTKLFTRSEEFCQIWIPFHMDIK